MINLKLIAISASVAMAIGFASGVKTGLWWQQDTIDDLNQKHNEQIQSIEAEAERDLKERQDQIEHWKQEFAIADTNYHRTLKDAKAENDRLIACIDSGECMPTVEIESPVCSATGANDPTEKADGKERARLSAKTTKDFISIAEDDDEEALSCNELIDWVDAGIKSGAIKVKVL
jgi:hypothetical protein